MTAIPTPRQTPRKPVPPLQNGDQLSRDEFERRYRAMPGHVKAELIEGVVYMPSPVSHRKHAAPHVQLVTWLGTYWAATPGLSAGDNGTLRLDLDNEPQPDAYLLVLPEHGGQAKIDEDDYVEGAPELVAEVAATSANYDLHQKLNAYRRNRVREYIVRRTFDAALDWFVLREGRYEALAAAADGIIRSEVLPGLWLDAAALIRGDLAAVLEAVGHGIASPEHAAFVAQLAQAQITQKT